MAPVTETFPEIPSVPSSGPGQPRKKRMGFAKKAFLTLLALLVIVVFAGYAYLRYTESKIDRIASEDVTALVPVAGGSGQLINFLIVGVDDRSTLPDDWEDNFGDFSGRRTDVIMVAHLVPGSGIQLLSIPRDLKSSIPGHGTNRINASYVFGGPDLLIQTVQSETGIPINHYAEIDFAGVGAVRGGAPAGAACCQCARPDRAGGEGDRHRDQRAGRGRPARGRYCRGGQSGRGLTAYRTLPRRAVAELSRIQLHDPASL